MRAVSVLLSSSLLLIACASSDSRYRDTSALEKPPTVIAERPLDAAEEPRKADAESATEQMPAAEEEEKPASDSKDKQGLGDKVVSLSDASPPELTVRQSFDKAWNSLKRAMIQSGIEVTDLDHDEGKFYVSYDPDSYASAHGSFLEKPFAMFADDYAKRAYVLSVVSKDDSALVTSAPAGDAEARKKADSDEDEKSASDNPADGAEKLLRSIYLTLRDDLREE